MLMRTCCPLSYDIIICRVSPLGIPQRAPAILKQVLHLKERESSGWKEGRKEDRKIGRKEDRKEGRKIGRKEDRKEGRKIGRKKGRKVDKKEEI